MLEPHSEHVTLAGIMLLQLEQAVPGLPSPSHSVHGNTILPSWVLTATDSALQIAQEPYLLSDFTGTNSPETSLALTD